MKYIYFFLLLFITPLVKAQNSLTDTNWHLQYINIDGIQFDNYFNYNYVPSEIQINFTESEFTGNSTCNFYTFSYLLENTNEVKITSGGITLVDCIGIPNFYEFNYLNIIGNDFSYLITGSGNGEILTLTSTNGNYAVFSKAAPTVTLFKTWYLKSIETSVGIVFIPVSESPTLNLTTDFHDVYQKSLLNGSDGCNDFNGFYDMYLSNQNSFKMFQYNSNSNSCGNTYSSLYASIVSNTTNTFDYSISNEGKTLLLTNNIGEKLVYSDKLLSTKELKLENSNIYLSKNPVNTHLSIVRSESKYIPLQYLIFSMDGGKTVNKGVLQNNSILIEHLHSGLYFLKIMSYDYKDVKTLKFVKE